MNKTKIVLAGFAVFAATLMLMTTSVARTMQENTTNNALEPQQNELMRYIKKHFANSEIDISMFVSSESPKSEIGYMESETSDIDTENENILGFLITILWLLMNVVTILLLILIMIKPPWWMTDD